MNEVVSSSVPEEESSGKAKLSVPGAALAQHVRRRFARWGQACVQRVVVERHLEEDRGIMLAVLAYSFTSLTNKSAVIPPSQQQQIADTLEDDAQVLSNAELAPLLSHEPKDVREEILHINKEARDRSLQVALLVPVLASLLGLLNAFRMRRLSDPTPASSAEGVALG